MAISEGRIKNNEISFRLVRERDGHTQSRDWEAKQVVELWRPEGQLAGRPTPGSQAAGGIVGGLR